MAGTCTIREKVGYMQVLFFKNYEKCIKSVIHPGCKEGVKSALADSLF